MDNLTLWKQVERTNPAHTKKVEFGRKFTAIDAHSQVMAATKAFGPCGIGWGIKNSKYEVVLANQEDPHYNLLQYTGVLWYRLGNDVGEIDIAADIELFEYSNKHSKWNRVEDTHKKVKTDALTKGLSLLGFNADVFMGRFDDNKYVQKMNQEFALEERKSKEPANAEQLEEIQKLAYEVGLAGADFAQWLRESHATSWSRLTNEQAPYVIHSLNALKKEGVA